MDWIRLKLAEAIGGSAPISKKLLLLMGSVVIAVILLINGVNSTKEVPVNRAEMPANDQVVVESAEIFVHVVGEVLEPGIYELNSNSRLMDAIFAAGGLTKNADQTSINLARELSDGEQVVVFEIGQAINGFGTGSSGGNGANGSSFIPQVSLNRASQFELESLPGVGPALAGRMIDWRTANGGFKKKEDLLNVSGIGDKLFAGIKDQVIL